MTLSRLLRIPTWFRIGLGVAVFAGAVLWGALLALLGAPPHRTLRAVARIMGRPICRIARLQVTVTGARHLLETCPAVVVGNQQSILCYCIYALLFQDVPDSRIMARLTGKWNIPVMTWLFRRTGNFIVDRGHVARTAMGFVGAVRALGEERCRVGLGPEGTRWKEPGRLGPFSLGAFHMALKAGVPIVPIVLSPLKPRTDLWAPRLEPNDVDMRVLEPVPTQGFGPEEAPALRDEVRRRMQQALTEMAAARGLE
ncbi:MAG: 1-acyl-sn-glycerol-3-phosphate acyltransferase, partial [Deltaproteobacteria bacterium]|nr:1-acyl-sn-glycerol-3-phosphate acyltransferase [Deltaproteobacteria bacterium]